MIINFAGQDQGLVQKWLVGAVVGAGWCTHSPRWHCHTGPAMPEQPHLL